MNALGWEFNQFGVVSGPETVKDVVEEFVRRGSMDPSWVQHLSAYADARTHAWPAAVAKEIGVLPPHVDAQTICNVAYVATHADSSPKLRVWAEQSLKLYLSEQRYMSSNCWEVLQLVGLCLAVTAMAAAYVY